MEEVERILCYGGKYYTISLDNEINRVSPLFNAYNYGSSINWAVDNDNLYAVIRHDEQGAINHYFLMGAIRELEGTVTLSDTGFGFTEPEVPDSWTGDEITSTNGITDATERDGALYFLYCQRRNDQTETRGFLYKIPDAANMSNNSDAKVLSGWTDGESHLPMNNGGQPFTNKLYNPLRFVAVKPEKLYIADGGFKETTPINPDFSYSSNINRITEFDLLDITISANVNELSVCLTKAGSSGGYTAY